jgi:predicted nucleotidyltransferase
VKRETLTRNLKEMMNRILHLVLPVKVLRVYVHGSYIRGDDLPGDLDIIILARVKDEWAKWHEAFRSLSEHHDIIWKYYETGMTLEDVMRGPLAPEIEKRGIPIDWAATMSWSELWGHTTLYMPYMLSWDRVTRRILTRGMKGLHTQLETFDAMFTPVSGRLHMYQELPVFLVWSSESPEAYDLEPTAEEYETYLRLEHEKLKTDMADVRFLTAIGKLLIEKSLPVIPKEKLEDVAHQVLLNTPKYEASEELLRQFLRKFDIPENKVYAIKQRGTKTWYDLARTEEEEIRLRSYTKTLEEKNEAESKVRKLFQKLVSNNEATKIDCSVLDLEKGKVMLRVTKPTTMDQNSFRRTWEQRGFEVEEFSGGTFGRKETSLPLDSDPTKLGEEIKRRVEG